MSDADQLTVLKQGVAAWNIWRNAYPLVRTSFDEVNLNSVNLTYINFSYTQFSAASFVGAKLWWTNFNGANLAGADFSDANLTGTDICDANLSGTKFSGARLYGGNFRRANLSGAKLDGANLTNADLSNANLSGADLRGACLFGARLRGTNLTRANLARTDFSGAIIGQVLFVDNDLRETKGLEAARHIGPSSIGIDTIYNSKGHIPQVFLRGAGVPDILIEYMPSLTSAGIEFYSCFISYSTEDQEFADQLYADLQRSGVRCWFAPHDMASGQKVHEQIGEAIRVHDKLLLILSPASIMSNWVKTEIANARKLELDENKRILFPVGLAKYSTFEDWTCFDAYTGMDSAREIREYYIRDFSNWKDHNSYQSAFKRLLQDLRAKQST